MNVIFTDFNGVLDDPLKKSNERNLAFELVDKADFEKVINLVKFAKEHNALILSISTYEEYTPIFHVIARIIFHYQDDESLKDYIDRIEMESFKLKFSLKETLFKEEIILDFIKKYPDAKYVSFEDDYIFSKQCHQIKINPFNRLTLDDLEKAKRFFID